MIRFLFFFNSLTFPFPLSLSLDPFSLRIPKKNNQKPGVTPDAAAEAMVVATFPAGAAVMKSGVKFELSRPGSLAAIFNKALGGAPQDVVESVSRSLGAFGFLFIDREK